MPQSHLSAGKPQAQTIYKKYLSDHKLSVDFRNPSYLNSPSSSSQHYESKYSNSGVNKVYSSNGNLNLRKSNVMANENGEEGRSSSKDLIAHHDLDYLFNKMEIIMIQQNKIYENFINFEGELRGEMQSLKEKVSKLENAVYGSMEAYGQEKRINISKTLKNDSANDKLLNNERLFGIFHIKLMFS